MAPIAVLIGVYFALLFVPATLLLLPSLVIFGLVGATVCSAAVLSTRGNRGGPKPAPRRAAPVFRRVAGAGASGARSR